MAARAEALGFRFPTGIQRKATSAFLDGDRLIVMSAQTGTGKTLAYLVPTVDQMDFVGRKVADFSGGADERVSGADDDAGV